MPTSKKNQNTIKLWAYFKCVVIFPTVTKLKIVSFKWPALKSPTALSFLAPYESFYKWYSLDAVLLPVLHYQLKLYVANTVPVTGNVLSLQIGDCTRNNPPFDTCVKCSQQSFFINRKWHVCFVDADNFSCRSSLLNK